MVKINTQNYRKNNHMNNKERIKELEEEIARLKALQSKYQMSKDGEEYHFITSERLILRDPFYGINDDQFRFYQGNCFKTEQEAKNHLERLLFENEVKKYIIDNDMMVDENSNENYHSFAILTTGVLFHELFTIKRNVFPKVNNQENANKLINHFGDRLKNYILNKPITAK